MITRTLLRSCALFSTSSSFSTSLCRPQNLPQMYLPTVIVPKPQSPRRFYASKSPADTIVEEIQELYATAKDEFEIASEETDKKSVYAEEDRTAAQEELAKLKSAFEKAVIGQEGKEVGRRVGGRIRELERAVEAMRERALEE